FGSGPGSSHTATPRPSAPAASVTPLGAWSRERVLNSVVERPNQEEERVPVRAYTTQEVPRSLEDQATCRRPLASCTRSPPRVTERSSASRFGARHRLRLASSERIANGDTRSRRWNAIERLFIRYVPRGPVARSGSPSPRSLRAGNGSQVAWL